MNFTKKVNCVVIALSMLLGTVSVSADEETKAVLFTDGSAVNYYAPCEKDFQIKIPTGLSFSDTEGIEVYNLGSNVLYDTPSMVRFNASATDNVLTISLNESPADNNRYKIVLPDTLTDNIGNHISPREFFFKAKQGETSSDVESKTNFSALTNSDLNYFGVRPSNDYIIGNDGFRFTKTTTGTRTEIIDESGCVGNKALKITERGVLATDIYDGAPYKLKKLKLDIRFKVISGEIKLNWGNSDGDTQILTATPTETKIFSQNSIQTDPTGTVGAAPVNGYTTISYEMDLDNYAVSKYILNGAENSLGEGKLPRYDGSVNLLGEGVTFISFENSKSKGEYLIDYCNITTISETPDVEKISFTDDNEELTEYSPGNKIVPSIDEVNVKFNNNMDISSLKNIIITDSLGEPVEYEGDFDENTFIYYMKPTDYFKQNSEYSITIPKTVCSKKQAAIEEIKESFETGNGKFEVKSVYLNNSDSARIKAITDLTNDFTLNAKIVNTIGKTDTVTVIYTDRIDKTLKSLQYQSFEVPADKAKVIFSFSPEKTANADEIKCFLWSDMKNHTPVINSITIK